MTNRDFVTADEELSFRNRHSFFIFVTTSIITASVIVVISMAMYNGSGAAQLDLSRPGYKTVRSKAVSNDSDYKNFSGNGAINKDIISDFKALFDKQTLKFKAVDAFGGDPLSPAALGMDAPSEL